MPFRYEIIIEECNNSLWFWVNDSLVFQRTVDDGVPVRETVDITGPLQPPPLINIVKARGDNGPHNTPWAFKYKIVKVEQSSGRSTVMYAFEKHSQGREATGTKFINEHQVVRE